MARSRVPLFASLVLLFILSLILLPSFGRAQTTDHVVISEVMYDPPQAGTDTNFEWIELFNPTSGPVNLAGWAVRDNTVQDSLPGFALGPGEYLVVAATAAGFAANYPGFAGNLVTLEQGIGNGLANGGDRVLLLDTNGNQVDAVSYGTDNAVFDPPCLGVSPGHSLARVPSDVDTDTAADWLDQTSPNPGGPGTSPAPTSTSTATATATSVSAPTHTATPTTTSTPETGPIPTHTGTPTSTPARTATATRTPTRTPTMTRTATPTPTPASPASTANPGDVVINEIMQNPKAVLDTTGEWFEVYNATGHDIDLNGWTIRDAGSENDSIRNSGPLWLPAGGYLVLGRNADPGSNGGVQVAYQYAGFTLGNADDEIILLDGTGTEIDRVAYDGGSAFPDPDGASMQLIRPDLDNAAGANWHVSPDRWPGSAGDRGSPGAANHTASIEGYVYEDLNGNGARGIDEPGIPDVLLTMNDGRTARSYADGWYGFFDLAPGTWVVQEAQPEGYVSTSSDEGEATLALGQVHWGPNFGELRLPPTASPTAGPSPTATPAAWPKLLLSEVFYDAPQEGSDSEFEWVEVYNPGDSAVSLADWAVADNAGQDRIPPFTLGPGGYLVIAAEASGFAANYPGFTGNLVSLQGTIGNGLSNTGDVVRLLVPDGTEADAMSYGDNTSAFAPPCPDVPAGQSLARVPSESDTDTAGDWVPELAPNPGSPGVAATMTPTPTPTLTPTGGATGASTPTQTPTGTPGVTPILTVTPTPTPTVTSGPLPLVRLNEILPRPEATDWDGNGTVDAFDEWIEVVNLGPEAVDLGGWALDDITGGGSTPYVFPAGTLLAPGEFLVRYRSTTRVALNQDTDTAHLLAPGGIVVDSFSYVNPRPDASYSRAVDGTGEWTDAYPPSPGHSNRPGTPTPTPTGTASPTATPIPTVTPTPTPTVTSGPLPLVRLNEILPRPEATDWDGNGTMDAFDEWIEVVNLGPEAVDLGGWALDDITGGGSTPYVFPPGTFLASGEFLVRYRSTTRVALNQDTDTAHLLAPGGTVVDSFSYVNPRPDASYSRAVDGTGEWTDTYPPSPGHSNRPGTPTPTPTGTASPTATPIPTVTSTPTSTATAGPLPLVRLNEILPWAEVVDWDGSGVVDAYDGWVEVVNLGREVADLGGWALDDILDGGGRPYVFPPGTFLAPGEFLVSYRSTTKVALNQDADTAHLLAPGGQVADSFSYSHPKPDRSYSRTTDGTGEWTDAYPPSPGQPNRPGTPTPTRTSTPTRTPAATRTPTPTRTATMTPTAVSYDPNAVRLNEMLPATGEIDWNGDGTANMNDEWVELYNRGVERVALGGWALDDVANGGSAAYLIPPDTVLQPGAFLLLFRSQTKVALNDDGDTVRLLGPDGAEVDATVYAKAKGDRSYSRTADGDGPWTDGFPPSPGRPNVPATPTPTPTATPTATQFPAGVVLNELLPDPQAVDWDQDGTANFADEWIELYNTGASPAALGGWAVADDTKTYTIPLGTVVWPAGYLLLFRRQTDLSLSDWHDQVTLLRPEGTAVDRFTYDRGPGADRSLCRSADGSGAWTAECYVTPGQANRVLPRPPSSAGSDRPTPTPVYRFSSAVSIAAARAAPPDTRVTVTGTVTMPPGVLDRTLYIQDATGGIKVYLRSGDYPALALGDDVRVTGWTRQFHGESELSVPGPSYLASLGPGVPPDPLYVRTGRMGEAHEGLLIWIMGRAVKFEPQAITLDDGSGPARVYFPTNLSWRRPYVHIGEVWGAQGVVGQYAFEAPWEGGYRLIPRFETDVSDAPMFLPVTGGG